MTIHEVNASAAWVRELLRTVPNNVIAEIDQIDSDTCNVSTADIDSDRFTDMLDDAGVTWQLH